MTASVEQIMRKWPLNFDRRVKSVSEHGDGWDQLNERMMSVMSWSGIVKLLFAHSELFFGVPYWPELLAYAPVEEGQGEPEEESVADEDAQHCDEVDPNVHFTRAEI